MSAPAVGTEFITPREAAELIGCHKETVLSYVSRGDLPAVRPLGIGRGKPVLIKRTDALAMKKKLFVVTGRKPR